MVINMEYWWFYSSIIYCRTIEKKLYLVSCFSMVFFFSFCVVCLYFFSVFWVFFGGVFFLFVFIYSLYWGEVFFALFWFDFFLQLCFWFYFWCVSFSILLTLHCFWHAVRIRITTSSLYSNWKPAIISRHVNPQKIPIKVL